MKNIFRNVGILALACFSFLVTDETITVVKESDKLMIEIKEKASLYYVEGVDGKIDDNYIRLGYDGLEIDMLKSYDQMKKIGYFNENMIIYKHIKPTNSLKDNKSKIIKGNFKNEISLVFKNPDNIDKIIKILSNNSITGSFLISKEYYLNNFEAIEVALNNSNDIIILDEYNFFKKELNKNYFCYSNLYEKCSGKYIVEESFKIKNYKELKDKLNRGSIVLIEETNYLDIYIKYILSRGFKVVNMNNFISENI